MDKRKLILAIIIFVIFITITVVVISFIEVPHEEEPIHVDPGDTDTLLYCKDNLDCLVPSKCVGASSVCEDNRCTYNMGTCNWQQIMNYLITVKTLKIPSPKIIELSESENKYTFNTVDDTIIAGQEFNINMPKANSMKQECQVGYNEFLSTNKKGCYSINVQWADFEKMTLENGVPYEINEHLTILYEISGRGVYKGQRNAKRLDDGKCVVEENWNLDYHWVNKCFPDNVDWTNTFTLYFTDIFEISIDTYNEKQELNSLSKASVIITNNLFDLQESGYAMKVTKSLLDSFIPYKHYTISYKLGESVYGFDLETDTIGIYTIEIKPYFEISPSQNYFENKYLLLGYYVTNSPEILDCKQSGCIIGECIENSCVISSKDMTHEVKK